MSRVLRKKWRIEAPMPLKISGRYACTVGVFSTYCTGVALIAAGGFFGNARGTREQYPCLPDREKPFQPSLAPYTCPCPAFSRAFCLLSGVGHRRAPPCRARSPVAACFRARARARALEI